MREDIYNRALEKTNAYNFAKILTKYTLDSLELYRQSNLTISANIIIRDILYQISYIDLKNEKQASEKLVNNNILKNMLYKHSHHMNQMAKSDFSNFVEHFNVVLEEKL